MGDATEPNWVAVRATVTLPGFPRGDEKYVDTNLPRVRRLIEKDWLRPLHHNPLEALMGKHWITVTDANGVDFDALTSGPVSADVGSELEGWVFFDKPSGFGNDVGEIALKSLKRLGDPHVGKYGAA